MPADSTLPPIDQNSAMFFNRHVVDAHYGGMAFEEEGARCAAMLSDPKVTTMIMGNHGVLIIGRTVAETFNRLTYFERAAETYIRALQTGQVLRVLSDDVAEKTAREWEAYPGFADAHLRDIKALLDEDGGFLAHVDLGRLGTADRWADLAAMSMSLEWNFAHYDEGDFWEAYGVTPDAQRIDYYRRLWNAE